MPLVVGDGRAQRLARTDRTESVQRPWYFTRAILESLRLSPGAAAGLILKSDADGDAQWASLVSFYAPAIDYTAQTADLNDTLTGLSGAAIVMVYHACTVAGTAGNLATTLSWTDEVGATTSKPAADLSLGAVGRASGSIVLFVASGAVAVATSLTGVIGSPQYSLRVRGIQL